VLAYQIVLLLPPKFRKNFPVGAAEETIGDTSSDNAKRFSLVNYG